MHVQAGRPSSEGGIGGAAWPNTRYDSPWARLHAEIYRIFFVELGDIINVSLNGLVVFIMS
jgi:hypothetical protein